MQNTKRVLSLFLSLLLVLSPLNVLAAEPAVPETEQTVPESSETQAPEPSETEDNSVIWPDGDPTENVPETDPVETTEPVTEPETTEPAGETTESAEETTESTEETLEAELFSLQDSFYPGTEERFSTSGAATLQTYVTQDGAEHQIYWAKGVTPPSMAGQDPFHSFSVFRESGFTHYQAPYASQKGYYDFNKTGTNSLCYLGAATNLICWWLDQNRDYVARYEEELQKPDGRFHQLPGLAPVSDPAVFDRLGERPGVTGGSAYLNQKLRDSALVKMAFTNNYLLPARRHKGYHTDLVHDFFFNGYQPLTVDEDYIANKPSMFSPNADGGYFFPIFGREKLSTYEPGGGYALHKNKLRSYLQQGLGVSLSVMSVSDAHALTLWGLEYDENGNLVRMYCTDTDDFDTNTGIAPTYSQALHSYDVQVNDGGYIYLNNRDDKTKISGYEFLGCYTLSLGRSAWEKAFADPNPQPENPVITGQPLNRSYNPGNQAEPLTVRAEVSGADRDSWAYVTPQWYEASDSHGSHAHPIQGATGWSYTPTLGNAPEERFYFCRVSAVKYGNISTVDSEVVKVEVTDVPVTNARPPRVTYGYSSHSVHQGEELYLSVIAESLDGGELSYQWYERNFDNLNGFVPVEGANEQRLRVPATHPGRFAYKCKVTNTNLTVNGLKTASAMTKVYKEVTVLEPKPGPRPQPALSILNVPAGPAYGQTFTPSVTGGAGTGAITLNVSGAAKLQADGSILVTDVGTITIQVTKAGDGDYLEARTEKTLTSVKAKPSVGTVLDPGNLTHKTEAADVVLPHTGKTPGSVKLAPGTRLQVGTHSYSWIFTPEDEAHYEQSRGQVELTVARAEKTRITITADGTEKPYTGKAHAGYENLKTEPVFTSALTISYCLPDGSPLREAPREAGAYQVVISIPEASTDYEGQAVIDFAILPGELTLQSAETEKKIYDGTAEAEVKSLSFAGLVSGETLVSGRDYLVSAGFDSPEAGSGRTLTIEVQLTDQVKNYVLKTGSLTLQNQTIHPEPLEDISLSLPAPDVGKTPVRSLGGSGWRAEIAWKPDDRVFRPGVSYEALVKLTGDANHVLSAETRVDGAAGQYFEGTLTLSKAYGILTDGLTEILPSVIGDISKRSSLWVDGKETDVLLKDGRYYLDLPHSDQIRVIETYDFSAGSGKDPHTVYPTHMKVYLLYPDGKQEEIPELRDLLVYCGTSIRFQGRRGIRMITGMEEARKKSLISSGTRGWKLQEYGTAVAWMEELPAGAEPVIGTKGTRQNFAYRRGVADPVFNRKGKQIQYTNVLVGFDLSECGKDIGLRSYAIFRNSKGQSITVYGGTLNRSIGYVAYQNRNVFRPGTPAYGFVWEMIHAAYGNRYDSEYKG